MSDGFCNIRLDKVCSANGYCTCTCKHKFDSISCIHNATHTDDGNINCLSNLIYQTHSNRANSRAAQTTGDVTKYRFLAFNINYSAKQGVNHRDCISTSYFYCFRHGNNISYIRRKFGDYHFRSISFYCTYNFSSSFGTSTENNAAFFYVGARDVDFNSIYTVNV